MNTIGNSQTVSVTITGPRPILACQSPGLTYSSCVSSGFSIGTNQLDIIATGFPFRTKLNGYFDFDLPFASYKVKQVSNINAAASDGISKITVFNNQLFFAASDPALGYLRLYRMIPSGAIFKVSQMNANASDLSGGAIGGAQKMAVFNNELYFPAFNSSGVLKLYKLSNQGGIEQISNINSASTTDDPRNFVVYNNFMYFTAGSSSTTQKLYKLSTSGQITTITNFNIDQALYPVVFNGELYFSGNSVGIVRKLMKVDSSDVITQVSNLTGSGNDENISLMIEYKGSLYFYAVSSSVGKMYKLDTSGVITQASNTNNGGLDSVSAMVVNGEHLYFVANNTNSAAKLFRMNESGNISDVANLQPATEGSTYNDNISSLVSFGGDLFFNGVPDSGGALFKIKPDLSIAKVWTKRPAYPVIYNNELYFNSTDNSARQRLFKLNKNGQF